MGEPTQDDLERYSEDARLDAEPRSQAEAAQDMVVKVRLVSSDGLSLDLDASSKSRCIETPRCVYEWYGTIGMGTYLLHEYRERPDHRRWRRLRVSRLGNEGETARCLRDDMNCNKDHCNCWYGGDACCRCGDPPMADAGKEPEGG